MQEDYKYEYVNVDYIEADPNQPRKNKPQSYIKGELAVSIANEGMKNAIDVFPHPKTPGWQMLMNGECRLTAVSMFIKEFWDGQPRHGFKIEDGKTYILARVYEKPMTQADVFLNQIMDNLVRKNMDPLETLEAIDRALNEHELPMEKVAKAFGKSVAMIEADLPILQLPTLMKREWDQGRLPKPVARKIASLKPSQFEKAYSWAKNGRTADVMLKKVDAYLAEYNQMSLWAEIKDGADEKTRKAAKVLFGQIKNQMEKFSQSPFTNGESKMLILCNKQKLPEIERTAKEMAKIASNLLETLNEFRVQKKEAVV